MSTDMIRGLAAKHHGELAKHIANDGFERAEGGALYVPRMGLMLSGTYRAKLNGKAFGIKSNIFVNEGLADILGILFKGAAAHANWYMSLGGLDVTPLETWTAASYPADAGELTTQYSQSARPACTFGTVSGTSIDNAGSVAVFTFTADDTIYVAGLHTVSGKGSTGGKLYSAGVIDSEGRDVKTGDNLSLEYGVDATDGT